MNQETQDYIRMLINAGTLILQPICVRARADRETKNLDDVVRHATLGGERLIKRTRLPRDWWELEPNVVKDTRPDLPSGPIEVEVWFDVKVKGSRDL